MVLWQGLTEGGTAVPVQVTEAGKVVAEGQQGPPGEDGKEGPQGPKGDQGPQGEYGPGDDVDLGSVTAAGGILTTAWLDVSDGGVFKAEGATDNNYAVYVKNQAGTITAGLKGNGSISAAGTIESAKAIGQLGILFSGMGGPSQVFSVNESGNLKVGSDVTSGATTGVTMTPQGNITAAGSISAADNAAGITSTGELYLTSRGTRYKLVVAGGLVTPEPYTREMELRERAEALRKPRTTDSVPED